MIQPQPVPTGYTIGNCSGYTPVSEIFSFNIETISCRAGEDIQRQLMWKNRYGHYDYYTFTAGKSEGLSINRQSFTTWLNDWGSSSPSVERYSRGQTDFQVSMNETHVINSGFLNIADFQYLEELYTSDDVYEIRTDGLLTPINIVNTEFIRKTKGNKDIVNIELTYVYSSNIDLLYK
jgi:hypothetical protein